MLGSSVIKGLSITLKKFFGKKVTQLYPEVKPKLSPRTRSSFAFNPEKCTACNICATACPNRVIQVQSGKDEKGKKVLENYNMNLGSCLFCGLCVEACPFDAINFSTDFEHAYFHRDDLNISWKGPKKEEKKEEDQVNNESTEIA